MRACVCVCVHTIIKEWRQKPRSFIAIDRNLQVDTMLFPDDLVLIVTTEDDFYSDLFTI